MINILLIILLVIIAILIVIYILNQKIYKNYTKSLIVGGGPSVLNNGNIEEYLANNLKDGKLTILPHIEVISSHNSAKRNMGILPTHTINSIIFANRDNNLPKLLIGKNSLKSNHTDDIFYNLTTISIPPFITLIGQNAFWGNSNLKSIIFEPRDLDPNNKLIILYKAFYSCGLEEINIPHFVQFDIGSLLSNEQKKSYTEKRYIDEYYVGNEAFSDNLKLLSVTFGDRLPGNKLYVYPLLFERCFHLGHIEFMIIDPNDIEIGPGAFKDCLNKIELIVHSLDMQQYFLNLNDSKKIEIFGSEASIATGWKAAVKSITITLAVNNSQNNTLLNCLC